MNIRTFFFQGLALSAITLVMPAGYASTSAPLKAKELPPSAFLEHSSALSSQPKRAPFQRVWQAEDLGIIASKYQAIYIAPVNTQYLRPINRPLVKILEGPFANNRPIAETTNLLHNDFADAFKGSPLAHLKVANSPGPGVLTLEIALVDLNPTNVVGNAARYGAPGGSALAPITKGNIAIEAKVRDSRSGKLLYEFADNEQDRFAIVSLRDLSSYGHSRVAMKEWAKGFEELTRTTPDHKVPAQSSVTLNPF